MARTRSEQRRYEAAVRRQIAMVDAWNAADPKQRMYMAMPAPVEDFLRPGDTADQLRLINGVPANRWGTWCEHGQRIVEPDPVSLAANPDFPAGRIVQPWPCNADGCTGEKFERDMERIAFAQETERWDEYRRLVGA